MVATAAHLVDEVIPRVPMRQWVLSLPKRLRPALRQDATLATRVLRIFLAVEQALRVATGPLCEPYQFGAISFVQRFGSSLNGHWHYPCCVVDGLFCEDPQSGLRLAEIQLDADQMAAVQPTVRRRVLAADRRRGWLDAAAAQDMAQWGHGGGFSIDASVRSGRSSA